MNAASAEPEAAIPVAKADDPRRRREIRRLAAHFAILLFVALYLTVSGFSLLQPRPLLMAALGAMGVASALLLAKLVGRIYAAHDDLDERHADLSGLSRIDPLTALLNRSAFMRCLKEIEQGSTQRLGVLFFDLDRFKDVNDTFGHRAGDQLLIEVAARARSIVGDVPFARLGGDEFAALIPLEPDRLPETIGQALVEAFARPMLIEGKLVSIGASVGVAIGCPRVDGVDQLLRRADLAMYAAKGSTGGRCRMFDDALSSRQLLEGSIRVELGRSTLADDMSMLYQPVLDLRTGRLASVEALLRWKPKLLGDVTPSILIPIAEESGYIEKLTDWTLDTTLAAIQRLGDVGVAVNISPAYFKNPDFVHNILDRLLSARIKPELLTLEITEGVLIDNIERAQLAISRLRDVGIKVFLDDFGTGYSSLSYLQHFALDGLKLDKSFLRNVGERRQATQIVRTMVDFGHSLDMKVVVEGVENEWQLRLLQLIGCDLAQGYEIGVPMALEQIIAFKSRSPSVAVGALPIDSEISTHLRLMTGS